MKLLISSTLIVSCGFLAKNQHHYQTLNSAEVTKTILNFTGRVVDGPIHNSLCFADLNNSLSQDNNEPSSLSNAYGYFNLNIDLTNPAFKFGETNTVCIGGTDTVTNQPVPSLTLSSTIPENADTMILQTTPLTTILSSKEVKSHDDKVKILQHFGISQTPEDIMKTDYYHQATSPTTKPDLKKIADDVVKVNYQIVSTIKSVENTMKDLMVTGSIKTSIAPMVTESLAKNLKTQPLSNQNPFQSTTILEPIFQESHDQLSADPAITLDTNSQLMDSAIAQTQYRSQAIEDIDTSDTTQIQSIMISIDSNQKILPVITSSPNLSVTQNNEYSYTLVASINIDIDLSFTALTLPSWLEFNPATQTISGTPSGANVGSHDISLAVSDGIDIVSQNFTLVVLDVNDAPSISGTPILSINEDTFYEFQPNIIDFDGDDLIISITNKPSWATFDSTTGRLYGTPLDTDTDVYPDIQISVTDTSNEVAILTPFTIEVVQINDPPTMDPIPTQTINEDSSAQTITLTNIHDIEGNPFLILSAQSLTQELISNPAISYFMGSDTATLTYTPLPDQHGEATINVFIWDQTINAQYEFNVMIEPVNDAPSAVPNSITVDEDTATDIQLNFEDIDSESVTYHTYSQPAHGSVTINETTGIATYTPNLNYIGTDSFTFIVNDGDLDSTQATISITVSAINDAPVADDVAVTTNEDEAITLQLSGSDVELSNFISSK